MSESRSPRVLLLPLPELPDRVGGTVEMALHGPLSSRPREPGTGRRTLEGPPVLSTEVEQGSERTRRPEGLGRSEVVPRWMEWVGGEK